MSVFTGINGSLGLASPSLLLWYKWNFKAILASNEISKRHVIPQRVIGGWAWRWNLFNSVEMWKPHLYLWPACKGVMRKRLRGACQQGRSGQGQEEEAEQETARSRKEGQGTAGFALTVSPDNRMKDAPHWRQSNKVLARFDGLSHLCVRIRTWAELPLSALYELFCLNNLCLQKYLASEAKGRLSWVALVFCLW